MQGGIATGVAVGGKLRSTSEVVAASDLVGAAVLVTG
jgi:hypothetical protein